MMNKTVFFFSLLAFFVSCNNNKQESPAALQNESEKADFFPVTNYLKGQIAEIKSIGISPLKITTVNNKKDSVWVKPEELTAAFSEFLTPAIDSASMAPYFKESKFLDRSLPAFTFTYEPMKNIPASILLKRWDVYVNPENQKVNRIYIQKNTTDKKDMQLTWQTRGKSQLLIIVTDASGKQKVEKEEVIKWNFDDEEL